MVIFKQQLEEVIWMSQSVKRIIDVLRIWDDNQNNSDEEFWQIILNDHSYVISQIFAAPVVLIKEKAYVGGMKIDRNEARFVDYLYPSESSNEAILIEIKTPSTNLLGKRYRKGFSVSPDLSGSVIQVLDYRSELIKNLQSTV